MSTATAAQRYARVAGVLVLLSIAAGLFGELYVPAALMLPSDAAATVRNFTSHEGLFRLGFAGYLLEALCDVTLALLFYVLLKPVDRTLALLAAFFNLLGTALYAVAELFYYATPLILADNALAQSFSAAQVGSLGLLSFRLFGVAAGIFMVFYGVAVLLRGYLIYRSGYLPRWLGVILMAAGAAFVAHNFLEVLIPPLASDFLLLPMLLAALCLAGRLLVKGVDVDRWPEGEQASA